jgi:hypothetical protein
MRTPCVALPLALVCANAPLLADAAPQTREAPRAAPGAPAAPARPREVPRNATIATIHDPRSCVSDEPLSATARWTRVPLPDRFEVATMGFAGGALFLFGQDRKANPLAFRLDPETRRLQKLDAAPLASDATRPHRVQLPAVRCIAGRFVFWGDARQHRAWGAIYDPVRDAWRTLEPRGAPASSVSATDGKQLYVVEPGDEHEISAAAYDPATDRWSAIPPGPALGLTWLADPMFVGGKLLVWGCKNGWRDNCAGAAYDPAARSWQRIAPTPADIERDLKVFQVYPVVLGDAVFLFAPAYQSSFARTARLGPDLRWTPDRAIEVPAEVESYTLLGGRHQGYLWTGTWNAQPAPRFRMERRRIAPDLSTSEVARLPDPRSLPRATYPFIGELDRLQAAGSLFVSTRIYAETDAPDRDLWIQH